MLLPMAHLGVPMLRDILQIKTFESWEHKPFRFQFTDVEQPCIP